MRFQIEGMVCQAWLLLRMARYGNSFCTALQIEASLRELNVMDHPFMDQMAALKAHCLLGSSKVRTTSTCTMFEMHAYHHGMIMLSSTYGCGRVSRVLLLHEAHILVKSKYREPHIYMHNTLQYADAERVFNNLLGQSDVTKSRSARGLIFKGLANIKEVCVCVCFCFCNEYMIPASGPWDMRFFLGDKYPTSNEYHVGLKSACTYTDLNVSLHLIQSRRG